MSRGRKLIIGIMILLAVVLGSLGGGYAYLYFRVKSDVDAVLARVFDVVDTRYESLWYVPWNGNVLLTHLQIGKSDDGIRIERIALARPDRDAIRSLIGKEGTRLSDNRFLRLAEQITVERVTGKEFFLEKFSLDQPEIRLSLPDVFSSRKVTDVVSILAANVRFSNLSVQKATFPTDAGDEKVFFSLQNASFSGVENGLLSDLTLANISFSVQGKGGGALSADAIEISGVDVGRFFDNLSLNIASFLMRGDTSSLAQIEAEKVAVKGVRFRGGNARSTFETTLGAFSLSNLKKGTLSALRIANGTFLIQGEKEGVFRLDQLQIDNLDILDLMQDLSLHKGASGMFPVMRFIQHGVFPLKVDRFFLKELDLDVGKRGRVSLSELSAQKTYRDNILAAAEIVVSSFRISPPAGRENDALHRLGYTLIDISLKQKEAFSSDDGYLSWQLEAVGKDMVKVDASANFGKYPRVLLASIQKEEQARMLSLMVQVQKAIMKTQIHEASASVTDLSLIARMGEKDPNFAIQKKMMQLARDTADPQSIEYQILQPLVSFMENPGTLRGNLHPEAPRSVEELAQLASNAKQLAQFLNLSMTAEPPTQTSP